MKFPVFLVAKLEKTENGNLFVPQVYYVHIVALKKAVNIDCFFFASIKLEAGKVHQKKALQSAFFVARDK